MSMQGSPSDPGALFSAATWQCPPFNRWSFWHTRETLPTQRITPAAGSVRRLVEGASQVDVRAVPLAVATRQAPGRTVGDVLDDSFTDAWVVLQDGLVVDQWYCERGSADLPHAVMSVTKSVVGCVAGVLVGQGRLAVDDLVTDHVPELASTGWTGATVRHVLDMRSGVSFVESYTDPWSDLQRLDEWVGWRAGQSGQTPRGLYPFLRTLHDGAGHGGTFRYRSVESDVLGWVCERAAGSCMADLVSSLLWAPMGAQDSADIICDGLGTAIHNGGLCGTARDLARFGQLLLDGGAVPGEGGPVQILPAGWLRGAWAVDSDVRASFQGSAAERSFPGGWYRNQLWFRPGLQGDVLLCLGIHGQLVHVSRRTRTVCVKLSSWPTAQSPTMMQDALRACDSLGAALTSAERGTDRPGLVGLVCGASRHQRTSTGHGSVV